MQNIEITKEIKDDLTSHFMNNIICFDFNNYLVYTNITKKNINKNIGLNLDYRNNSIKYYSTEKSKYQNKELSKNYAKQILKVLYLVNKEQTEKILELYNLSDSDLLELSIDEKSSKVIKNLKREERKAVVKEVHKLNKINIKNKIHNSIKEKTKHINSKDKRTKREDIFVFSSGFNCIAEAFGIKTELKDNFESGQDNSKYFNHKIKKSRKNEEKQIHSLVLWDIENINFYDDFSILTRFVKKENQLKIVSFSKKYKDYYSTNIDFELNKLKKRKWIIKEVKSSENSADKELIKEYYNYCDELKEVIIISSDSDFSEILIDSKNKNIKTMIIYKELNQKNRWFKNADEIIELNKIKGE